MGELFSVKWVVLMLGFFRISDCFVGFCFLQFVEVSTISNFGLRCVFEFNCLDLGFGDFGFVLFH